MMGAWGLAIGAGGSWLGCGFGQASRVFWRLGDVIAIAAPWPLGHLSSTCDVDVKHWEITRNCKTIQLKYSTMPSQYSSFAIYCCSRYEFLTITYGIKILNYSLWNKNIYL